MSGPPEAPENPLKSLNALLAQVEARFLARTQELEQALNAAREESERLARNEKNAAEQGQLAHQALEAERALALQAMQRHAEENQALGNELARIQSLHEQALHRGDELAALPALLRRSDRRMADLARGLEQLELALAVPAVPAAAAAAPTASPAAPTPPTRAPTPRDISMPIRHVNHLLALPDDQFVEQVYLTLLGRSPDPAGAAFFAGRLAEANDRAEMICEIAQSAEGRARMAALPGLEDLIQQYTPRAGRVRQWLARLSRGLATLGRLEPLMTVHAQRLGTQTQAVEQQVGQLQQTLAEMRQELAAQQAKAQASQLALADSARHLAALRAHQDVMWEVELPRRLRQIVTEELQAHRPAGATGAAAQPAPPAAAIRLDESLGPAAVFTQLADGLAGSAEARQLASKRQAG
jgi:hypothetical protein